MEPTQKAHLEREKTDRSLRTERENSDRALADKVVDLEAGADEIVERARAEADAVLDEARGKEDRKLGAAGPPVPIAVAVEKQRAREDSAIEAERAVADESLDRAREGQASLLAALLPLEREKTDRHLLTERTQSDGALAQRDDFMGMVTHDLRDLLNGIVLQTTLLSKKASASDEGQRTVEAMARIQRYVARMSRLVGDLVDVVSIDAGRLAVQPDRGDARALLEEAASAFEHAAAVKGVSLVIEGDAEPLPAVFDHDRMLQVVANLISNALKFTPAGGHVVVRAGRAGDQLRLSVADTGPGIPASMLDAIFERFWQAGNDRRGLGLGLYISRCIVDARGGSIRAESEPGRGSTLHVLLPGAHP